MVLLEMIEYVIKCLLSLILSNEVLNIIYNKSVDALIEIDEFINLTALHRCSILALKQTCCDIKHPCARITLLDADTDCLNKVGLPHSARAKNKQWIECLKLRVVGNSLANRTCHLITVAYAIVLKRVVRIKLGIDILHHYLLKRI